MPDFWNLPRKVRDKIYRMHLVFQDPVSSTEHDNMCRGSPWRKESPSLLRVSDKMDREAAPIYYGENHFVYRHLNIAVMIYFAAPRHVRLIKRITCDWNPDVNGVSYAFEAIARLKGLEELNIRVDERKMVFAGICKRDVRQRYSHPSEKDEYSAQEQLAIYRYPGMSGLLSLRGIPTLNFLKRMNAANKEIGGPIPNGVLLTQVLPKVTSPVVEGKGKAKAKKGKAREKTATKKARYVRLVTWHDLNITNSLHSKVGASHFDFLGLPAELRNWIYDILLRIDGPIHPSKQAPSTASKAGRKIIVDSPQSALCVLAVNKQIREEAIGIYSTIPMVFYYPTQFHAFYNDLSPLRRSVLTDITIHHANTKLGGVDLADLTFSVLRELTGLRRLHVILEGYLSRRISPKGRWVNGSWPDGYHMEGANPALIPGLQVLFRLRGLTAITVRDKLLEESLENARQATGYPDFEEKSQNHMIVKLSSALAHFNAALSLAQKGLINEELLEDNKWHTWDSFPELPEEEEESDEEADDEEIAAMNEAPPADEQAIGASGMPTPSADGTVEHNSAATISTGPRRSARISNKLANTQLVANYNEDGDEDEDEVGDEDDGIGEEIEVYRGRAVSVEL